MNKLNTLAFFAGYEIVTDVNGQVYLIKEDHTSIAADSVRDAVLMVPMQYRKGLMDQYLIRNDNIVSPMYQRQADENERASE
jgi:hypothetical protein